MSLKKITKKLVYQLTGDRFTDAPEWEYVPEGWKSLDPKHAGWNVETVLETQKAKWPVFLDLIKGNGPLGIAHEAPKPTNQDVWAHNTMMSYAYALSLVARKKDKLSMLDWGGGIGHYYPLSKAIIPDVEIEYHCKDVSLLCEHGRSLYPEAKFYSDDETPLKRSYDFVLVSGSLQYFEDWKSMASKLSKAATSAILITRSLFVKKVPSFVTVQRSYKYGYKTEYLGWFINRDEFLQHMASCKMELKREFIMRDRPRVFNAPEEGECRGFLFEPRQRT